MATLYKYGTTSVYEQITRTNSGLKLNRTTRKTESGTNKSAIWKVSGGDQIRFNITSASFKGVREIPASGSTTTNEWFWGSIPSFATNQLVSPINAIYNSGDGRYHATIPSGATYFIVITASTTFVNSDIVETYPVEKYVQGQGWVPIDPYTYDTNNGWQTGDIYKRSSGAWS